MTESQSVVALIAVCYVLIFIASMWLNVPEYKRMKWSNEQ